MPNTLDFIYNFDFGAGRTHTFEIHLDPVSLALVTEDGRTGPDWTLLGYKRCPKCDLDASSHRYCPVSLNIVELVETFKNVCSTEEVTVRVKTPEREVCGRNSVQKGLSSILGIYMPTSGCTILDKLRPMVRYHLPFSSMEETVYISAATYLLGQYFRHKKGLKADWELEELVNRYRDIEETNCCIVERLKAAVDKDSSLNALIILDTFAKFLPMSIETSLRKIEHLFREY